MIDRAGRIFAKSLEGRLGAESEFANRRFNNAANRAYYAVYQAAVAALIQAGVSRSTWEHQEVQALFAGELIRRRKLYARELRSVMYDLYELRVVADYGEVSVSETRCRRALRRAQQFIQAVEERIVI